MGSCYLVPAATVSVLVPPASSSFTWLVKVWDGSSPSVGCLDPWLSCPNFPHLHLLSKTSSSYLLCLPPGTQGSHIWSWNYNFIVAVAFICGVACLLADKKITVHLKTVLKLLPSAHCSRASPAFFVVAWCFWAFLPLHCIRAYFAACLLHRS